MKRIRPAPMGRAFRYVRRISHIEIELAERGKNGEAIAHVVGAERLPEPQHRRASPARKLREGAGKEDEAARRKKPHRCQGRRWT